MTKLSIVKLSLLALCAGLLTSTPARAAGRLFLTAFNEETKSDTLLYFVKPDGTLWWQADTITTRPSGDGKNAYNEYYEHKLGTAMQVGEGWDTPREIVPGGASTIYVIRRNGDLEWFRHDGYLSGQADWKGPIGAGVGWADPVIPMGNGVLYSLSKNGTLRWNRHETYATGFDNYGDWAQPALDVMIGWNKYKAVIGGGDGVFYAVTTDGKLIWFRHTAYMKPVAYPAGAAKSMVGAAQLAAWAKTWQGPKEIGSAGWGDFLKIFCAGNGHIYMVKPDGTLAFYDHTGWKTGAATWGFGAKYPDQTIADGWKDYVFTFAALPG